MKFAHWLRGWSLKCAIANIPYGAQRAVLKLTRQIIQAGTAGTHKTLHFAIAPIIGADSDIPAPDANTNAQTMACAVLDTLQSAAG